MTTSLVHRGGRGLWCPDWLLEPVAHGLGSTLQRDSGTRLRQVGARWCALAVAPMPGCLELGLDALSVTEVTSVLGALDELARTPDASLEAGHLNEIGLGTRFDQPIERDHWTRACTAISAVLDGTWPYDASDPESLPRHWLHPSPR